MADKEVKKRVLVLDQQRMGLIEFKREHQVVDAEAGTTLQDVLDPAYWSYVAMKLKPGTRVDVYLETGEWMAELLVAQVDRTWAKVHLLHFHDLAPTKEEAPTPQKYEVLWRGQHHKWAVRRLSDQEVVQQGFEDKDAARTWLRQHERVVATT